MFSKIRSRIGYTNLALTLALVFAMSGGALAASKYLITSTKQISPKVLKALKGKTGSAGAKGETGPAGKDGATGKEGPAGKEGTAGKDGLAGKDGKDGKEGKEGSPWTVGGVLPEGRSEKGVWAVAGTASEAQETSAAPISFTIPLATAPTPHFIGEEEGEGESKELKPFPGGCKGTAESPANVTNPVAQPGNLCVYAHQVFNAKLYLGVGFLNVEVGGPGAGKTGTGLFFEAEAQGKIAANGVWAVTAE
jgi:hypothetical protein